MIDSTGLGIIIPVLPSLVADTAHVTLEQSTAYFGWIIGSYALMQFLFSPVVGGLSDRYGRRPVLLLSLFGLGIDYVFMYFAPSLVWLIIGRCISGMFGASFTAASAYIADVSTKENKTKNFGMVGAAFGVGFVFGTVIGGLIGGFNPRAPFLVAAGLSLVNLAYGFFVLKESLPLDKRRAFSLKRSNPIGAIKQMKKYKSLAGLFVVIFLYYLAAMAIHTSWVYYTSEKFSWSTAEIGVSLAIVGIFIAIVQGGLTGRFSKAFGDTRTAFIGMFIYMASLLGIAFAAEGWMLYALMIPYAFTGLASPAIKAIMSNNTVENEQGELQGSITSVISIAEIIGPLMMMWLFAQTTIGLQEDDKFYGSPFILATVFVFIGTLVFAYSTKKR